MLRSISHHTPYMVRATLAVALLVRAVCRLPTIPARDASTFSQATSANEPTRQIARSLKRMKGCRTRLLEFLFVPEMDRWLAILRVGLGIEVMLYSMSLRTDWTYLLSSRASLHAHRAVGRQAGSMAGRA